MMNSNLDAIFGEIRNEVENMAPINARMKLKAGEHVFLIDGTGDRNLVSRTDDEANCTVRMNEETFLKLKTGKLDPITGLMMCKINIDGDMGLAFRLRSLISA